MIMKRKQTQKIEFEQPIVKSQNPEIPKRPNSGKLAPIIKSPLPPRKATLSQHHNQKKQQQEPLQSQDIKVIQIRSMTPNQQKLFQHNNPSPVKLVQKQQIAQSEKKIIVIPKRPEKQQFRITNKIDSSVEKKNQPFKGRSPNQDQAFNWANTELTKVKDFLKQKQNNIREQHYKQSKQEVLKHQPKCAQDFSMTSHKNDLPQLLKNYQQEIKEARQQYSLNVSVFLFNIKMQVFRINCEFQMIELQIHENSPPLNMSEIMEINEDGLSSLAQSTYHHQMH